MSKLGYDSWESNSLEEIADFLDELEAEGSEPEPSSELRKYWDFLRKMTNKYAKSEKQKEWDEEDEKGPHRAGNDPELVEWRWHGVYHREDGPAVITIDGKKEYYLGGKLYFTSWDDPQKMKRRKRAWEIKAEKFKQAREKRSKERSEKIS